MPAFVACLAYPPLLLQRFFPYLTQHDPLAGGEVGVEF